MLPPALFSVSVFVSLVATAALAKLEYQAEIPNGANVIRNGQAWPAVGHQKASGGGELNSFGIAFKNNGFKWDTALCNADTDGDGFTNGAELGDPECQWVKGGHGPEWNSSISHPGYSDSRPVGLPVVFRLLGPSVDEGVLQARIFPNPWGVVALPMSFLTPEWAKHFCWLTNNLDDGAWGARAWGIWDRDAADRQYLGPDEYVSVSEPERCDPLNFKSCTVRYSKPDTPQNLTNAVQGGYYVKCRYSRNNGTLPFTQQFRLRGAQPGTGFLDAYWPAEGKWHLVNTSMGSLDVGDRNYNRAAPNFACRSLLKIAGGVSEMDIEQRWSRDNGWDVRGSLTMCDPDSSAEYCYYNRTFDQRVTKMLKFTCGTETNAFSDAIGPSTTAFVFATEKGFTQHEFLTLLANRTGFNDTSAFIVQRWQPAPVQFNMTHGAVYVNLSYFGGINPSKAFKQVVEHDTDIFGIIASDFVRVPLASLDPTAPESADDFEFRIVGPKATEGVVQVRPRGSSSNASWGMVAWREDDAWATEFCRRSNVSDPRYIARLTPLNVDATFHKYAPANRYLALSDPTDCEERWQAGNLSACRYIYSPPGQPRQFGSWEDAAYVECRAETFPDLRLHGYQTCWGQLEIKPTGASSWDVAATSFTAEEVCAMVGCNCSLNPAGSCGASRLGTGSHKYFVRRCDPSNAATSCQTDVFNPAQPNFDAEDPAIMYHCGTPGVVNDLSAIHANTWLRGPRIDSRPFGLPNVTKEQFRAMVDSRWGLDSKPDENTTLEILDWNNTAPAQNGWMTANIRVFNDKPYGGIITHIHMIYYNLGYSQSNIHNSYHFGTRKCINAPEWAYPPGQPEFRLVGPRDGDGFVEGRITNYVWETGKDDVTEWGSVVINYDVTSSYARLFCERTNNFHKGYLQRALTSQVTSRISESAAFLKRTGRVTFNDVYCAAHTAGADGRLQPIASFENNCTWIWNEIERSNYYSNDRQIYVQCKVPQYKFRVVGPFRGIGTPEVYVDNKWQKAYTSGSGHLLAPLDLCRRFAGFNDPNWAPRIAGFGDDSHEWIKPVYFYECDEAMDLSDCIVHHEVDHTRSVSVECVEPPIDTAFAQTSVLYMNGVLDRRYHEAGKKAFPGKAAAALGLQPEQIFLSQWNDHPKDELIWVTLTLNATGINAGLALNNLAAADLGWKGTDVRPIPVYNEIAPPAWQWSVERDLDGGMRGNIIARPSRHYAYGVPCAKTWTDELTRLACKTVFGYVAPEDAPPPRFRELPLEGEDNVRNMYLDDIICDFGFAEILGNCSFAYANGPSARCPGTSNIYIDCVPPTETVSISVVPQPTTPAPPTTAGAPTSAAPETADPGTTPPGPGTVGPVGTDTATARHETTLPATTEGGGNGTGMITTHNPDDTTTGAPGGPEGSNTAAPATTTAAPAATNATGGNLRMATPTKTVSKSYVPPQPSFDARAEEVDNAVDEVLDNPLADAGASGGVALAGAAGGGAALDMQGVMVLSAANCQSSRNSKQKGERASNIKAVVPWRFADSPAGGVGAIIVMILGVGALQALAAAGVKLSGHRDTWWHSFARVKCPSIVHAVFVLLLQGLCLETALCLIDESVPVKLCGVLGLAVTAAATGARVWLIGDPRERMGVEPEPYEKLHDKYHPLIAIFLPAVFWHPADEDEDPEAAGQFGSFISPCRQEFGAVVVIIQLLKRMSIAASVVIASTALPCEVSYVVVIIVHLGSAAFALAKRPMRKGMENFLTGSMDVFIVTIAASLWLGAPVWVITNAMVAAAIVSFAAGVIAVVTFLCENRKWKPEELELDEKTATALLQGADEDKNSPLLGIPKLLDADANNGGSSSGVTDSPSASPRNAALPADAAATKELEAALGELMLGGGPPAASDGSNNVQYLVVEETSSPMNPLAKKK